MNRAKFVFFGILMGVSLMVVFLLIGSMTNPITASGNSPAESTPGITSDEGTTGWNITSVTTGDEALPALSNAQVLAPNALPTQVPGETTVYFFTTDSDATATVLFLLNTDAVPHTVALRGFSYNGVLVYSLNINGPATSILRLTSDSIASAPPPSSATPAPIITNVTDFTYFASLSLPKGVKVEGYTIYNPGTGTVDPRADQGAIPLRFSTDPATVFVPALSK
jgi:hypothetical protein